MKSLLSNAETGLRPARSWGAGEEFPARLKVQILPMHHKQMCARSFRARLRPDKAITEDVYVSSRRGCFMRHPAFLFALSLATMVAFAAAPSSRQPTSAPQAMAPEVMALQTNYDGSRMWRRAEFGSHHSSRWSGIGPPSNPCVSVLPRRSRRASAFGWLISRFAGNFPRRWNCCETFSPWPNSSKPAGVRVRMRWR